MSFGKIDGPGTERGDLGADVYSPPSVELFYWRADLRMPGPHLVWRTNAEAGDPLGEGSTNIAKYLFDTGGGELPDELHGRIGIGLVQRLHHAAGEVDEIEIDAAPADLQSERKGAFGIERIGHRRLADAAPLRLALQQEAIVAQLVGDDRDRLRAEARHAGDVGFRQLAVELAMSESTSRSL